MTTERLEHASVLTAVATSRRRRHRLLRLLREEPIGVVSVVVLIVAGLAAIAAPILTPYDPYELGPDALSGPSLGHLAGTDQYGRDVLTRLLYGARVSLAVGLGAALLSTVGALFLGLVFTYAGGWFDYLYQRFVETVMALPSLILLMVLVQIVGPSVLMIVAILGVLSAIRGSRIMRSAILAVKAEDYVQSAVVVGARPIRVMVRHLVPNVFALSIVTATLQLGSLIISEASLSFLGLGIRAPTPSWGGMMGGDGRQYIIQAPWMLLAPAAALCLTVIAANMAGDMLRDRLDPRLRGRGGRST